MALYLVLATPPLLLPGRPSAWPLWLALHMAAALVAWPPAPVRRALEAFATRLPRTSRLVLDWYPLAFVPVLYAELSVLIPALHGNHFFDEHILRVEEVLFGGQPSRSFAAAFPFRWLSELMHAGYLSYYFLIYLPPIALYAAGQRHAADRAIFTVILTYALHYLFFLYYPVQGPHYVHPDPVAPEAMGPLYRLTHAVLDAGASRGAAFPSSHVGVAVAQVLTLARFRPRPAAALSVAALLLALGAVYGGYHYATDAVCGALLGSTAVLMAPVVYRMLGGRWQAAASRP
jgi:membrane-associated phospholipid phosphatase